MLLSVLGGLAPAVATSAAASSAARTAARRPDVVLVTLDTVRADRMGFLGSARGLTPALDAFAREGVVFEDAERPAPSRLLTQGGEPD